MFREVSTKLEISDREKEILKFWQEQEIFKKSLENRSNSPEFVFYEGPPTANGKPGIHHVMARTVKDVVCRYKSMQGFLVRRKAGWDTHGLPVEIEVEKSLKINGKADIEKFGIAEFNKKCRESVFHYKKEWDTLTERIGYWLDLDDPYITFTNEYIESVWWILKELWKKDLIYKGFKILPYCPRCETPISSHEVSQGYKEVKDPSIYVRMKVKGRENAWFLVWTTTPWTLISNVAIAVGSDVDYVELEHEGEIYIMAEERISDLFEEDGYTIVKSLKGRELAGIEYERLFDFVPADKKAFYVIEGDFVTTGDGTGIVHIAPAFGEDDYQVGRKYDLPVLRPVNESGKFEPVVTAYAGQFVKDADEKIIADLRQAGRLVKKKKIEHSYPHCWRCDTPLLYYARESWYIATSRHKEDLLKNNELISWHPPEVGEGRFGEWLKNNIDWSLSRDRYWGTPLNIWVCDSCNRTHSVGSIAELRELNDSVPEDIDLHKPYVDDITFGCTECEGTMRRTPEVIDCWFDSGSMPYAQYHYPFENKELFEKNFPADFICEGIDQTRGWFYSLLAISTLLFDKPAFKNIVVNELILDKEGQKMSKTKGNVVVPEEIISKYGADTIRWYLMTTSPPWTPKRFDEEGVKEVLRKFINTLVNTYSFFVLYANIDGFTGSEEEVPINDRPEIDRWIMSRLFTIVDQVNKDMKGYELTRAARRISDFLVDDVSNWYVRRNRRRFWKSGDSGDKQAAYQTLHEVLHTIARMIAPYTPFIAEDIFTNLRRKSEPESVHLADFPKLEAREKNNRDEALEARMALAQKVVSISHSLRNESKIKVRQPLKRVLVALSDRADREAIAQMADIVCDEINVKKLETVSDWESIILKKMKPNFKVLGPKVGKLMGKIKPIIEDFDSEQIASFEKNGYEHVVVDGTEVRLEPEDIELLTIAREGMVAFSDESITVALDIDLTEELIEEGTARELVNRIQNLRKDADYSVTDRIGIVLEAAPDTILKVFDNRFDYIKTETLATKKLSSIAEADIVKEISVNSAAFKIGLKRVS